MHSNVMKSVGLTALMVLLVSSIPALAAAGSGGETSSKSAQQEETSSSQTQGPERTGRLGLESPTGWARAELTVFQALHGMALGAEICLMAKCDITRAYDFYTSNFRPVGGSMLLGLGVGVGVPLLATRNGILPGHALSLNSGVMWGLWYGTAAGIASQAFYSTTPRAAAVAPFVAGQLGGLALGAGLYQIFRPTQGDVALVNSFGLWSGFFTLGSFGLSKGPVPGPAVAGTMIATTTAAAVGAGFLARRHPMSRMRVWAINGSGMLGALVSTGVTLLATPRGGNTPLSSGMAMLGGAAGLGIGAWLTNDWSIKNEGSPAATAQLHLAPAPRGSGGMLQLSGSF